MGKAGQQPGVRQEPGVSRTVCGVCRWPLELSVPRALKVAEGLYQHFIGKQNHARYIEQGEVRYREVGAFLTVGETGKVEVRKTP